MPKYEDLPTIGHLEPSLTYVVDLIFGIQKIWGELKSADEATAKQLDHFCANSDNMQSSLSSLQARCNQIAHSVSERKAQCVLDKNELMKEVAALGSSVRKAHSSIGDVEVSLRKRTHDLSQVYAKVG